MNLAVLAAITLLQLTGPDGQVLEVNPSEIVSIRVPRRTDHFARGTHCLVFTTDNKYLAVAETCKQVEASLKAQNHGH